TLRMKFFSNSLTASSKRMPREIIWSIIASSSVFIGFLWRGMPAGTVSTVLSGNVYCSSKGDCWRRSSAQSAGATVLNGERQVASGEQAICFEILLAGYFCNITGKRGGGWALVPIKCLKIIAHKLFIERRLRFSRRVGVPRPEPGRIRGQHFID